MAMGRRYELVAASLALFVITLSVNLQVPLYRAYAGPNGYGEGFVALIFAAYVAGLVPVLILLGGTSDYIGSKPTLCLATALALTANGLMLFEPNIPTLFCVRFLQGCAVGFALGASAAFLAARMSDLSLAANLHGILVAVGLGGGALLTSVSQYLHPLSVPLSYYGMYSFNLLCLLALTGIRYESPTARESLIKLPVVTADSLIYCLVIFGAWSLTGVIIAVVPSELSRVGLNGWAGLIVFLSVATGALFQPLCRKRSPIWALRVGAVLALCAYACLVVSIRASFGMGIILASAMAGASGLGFIYIGGLVAVMAREELRRARAVSGYFLFGYLGLGLPCVVVGYATERYGLTATLLMYGGAVLSILAAGFLARWNAMRERPLSASVQS